MEERVFPKVQMVETLSVSLEQNLGKLTNG
jgi:hypothetical protein